MMTKITLARGGVRKGVALICGTLLLTTILLFGTAGELAAQSVPDTLPRISAEQLRNDITALRDSLGRLHPGLYRYQDKPALEKAFARCYRAVDHPMTLPEFFRHIDALIGKIEDGHTECFMPADVNQWIKTNAGLFPAGLWVTGKHAYLLCNAMGLPAGAEILAVNGSPMPEIIGDMLGELSSDGANLTGKYDKINRGHDPFPYLYFVLHGSQDSFRLSYRTQDGHTGAGTVQARRVNAVVCILSMARPSKYLRLEYPSDGVAVLTIGTLFNELLATTGEQFGDFLSQSFRDIREKDVGSLIIDLRGNGGGDDTNGSLLYSYLTGTPFSYYRRLDKTSGPYTRHPNLAVQQPNAEHYDGRLFILTNGGSFSSTAEFAAIVRSNRRGLFIGEETGGGYYGNTSGDRTTIYLPNTKIRVNIPLTRYTLAVRPLKNGGRGVVPDVKVAPTISDKLSGRDPQMAAALKLARAS